MLSFRLKHTNAYKSLSYTDHSYMQAAFTFQLLQTLCIFIMALVCHQIIFVAGIWM